MGELKQLTIKSQMLHDLDESRPIVEVEECNEVMRQVRVFREKGYTIPVYCDGNEIGIVRNMGWGQPETLAEATSIGHSFIVTDILMHDTEKGNEYHDFLNGRPCGVVLNSMKYGDTFRLRSVLIMYRR